MKFKPLILAAALIMAASFILVGCEDTESDSLARVKKSGQFTVVGSGGYPPFNYIDEDGKTVIGFDVDTGAANVWASN